MSFKEQPKYFLFVDSLEDLNLIKSDEIQKQRKSGNNNVGPYSYSNMNIDMLVGDDSDEEEIDILPAIELPPSIGKKVSKKIKASKVPKTHMVDSDSELESDEGESEFSEEED